ncbi:hypothetical protein J437_LFUL016597 [Ladona fulva]|uniref:BTB domain-containing protein n=1 Tax=Ladona fulva TaxID=123851 RepID=A0A8K0KLZ1_LADFU|nr:hypothetical protein J437_LFUL016597 [Ladona fulva]
MASPNRRTPSKVDESSRRTRAKGGGGAATKALGGRMSARVASSVSVDRASADAGKQSLSGVPQLLEDLQKLSEDKDSADVVFLLGREEVPVYAHRIVLMARQDYTQVDPLSQ